jgi:TonB family protein
MQSKSRSLVYRNAGVKAIFNRDGSSGQRWKLQGLVDAKTLKPLSADKLARRFSCANAGHKWATSVPRGENAQRRAADKSKKFSGQMPTVAHLTIPPRIQVSQGVAQGLLIKRTQPIYPPLARQARVRGTVLLLAEIAKNGDIETLRLISGHPMLASAAIDAVKQWKYRPYILNGEPVEVETQITVNFTLSGG